VLAVSVAVEFALVGVVTELTVEFLGANALVVAGPPDVVLLSKAEMIEGTEESTGIVMSVRAIVVYCPSGRTKTIDDTMAPEGRVEEVAEGVDGVAVSCCWTAILILLAMLA